MTRLVESSELLERPSAPARGRAASTGHVPLGPPDRGLGDEDLGDVVAHPRLVEDGQRRVEVTDGAGAILGEQRGTEQALGETFEVSVAGFAALGEHLLGEARALAASPRRRWLSASQIAYQARVKVSRDRSNQSTASVSIAMPSSIRSSLTSP
mgnify:CR=1 FL=1